MKSFFTLFFMFISTWLSAQGKPVEHRIILYSGEIISGMQLSYESPLLKQAFFTLDSETFESGEVSFFQNSHGYFANLARLHGENKERYAMRIRNGKIRMFEEVEISIYGGDELGVEENDMMQDPMLATGQLFEYYNIGDKPVREATYANLKIDLADNESSMSHLRKHRMYKLLQFGLLGLGTGIVTYDVIRQSTNAVTFNPFMAFGIVIGGSSYFLNTPKQDELWHAAEAYNEEEGVAIQDIAPAQ